MRISSIGYFQVNNAYFSSIYSVVVTYGGVQVDEDGSRDVFAATSLSEESLIGAAFDLILRIWVRLAISFEAMLEKVSVDGSICLLPGCAELKIGAMSEDVEEQVEHIGSGLQLPGTISKLSTSLADVDVADLYIGGE